MLEQISEAELKQAYLGSLDQQESPNEPCPTPEELWMTCTLELEQDRRLEIIDHCMTCKSCAQALSATREIVLELNQELAMSQAVQSVNLGANPSVTSDSDARVIELGAYQKATASDYEPSLNGEPNKVARDSNTVIRSSRWNKKMRSFVAGSAALAVAAGIAFMVTTERDSQEGQAWRGHGKASSMGATADSYRFEQGTFSWPASADVEHYELLISGTTGQNSCTRVVKTNSYRLVAEHCPGIPRSGPFFWKVRTRLRDGSEKESGFFAVSKGK